MEKRAPRSLSCDVAVVGAGIAGCAAAQAAAEAGASVVVVEKSSGITAHGLDVGAIGSRLQKEQGVEIDPLEAARLIYAWGQSKANYELIRVFTDRSGRVMDHYIDLARRYGLRVRLNDSMTARADWDTLEPRFRQFRTAHNFSPDGKPSAVEDKAAIRHFVRMLKKDAEEHGARFLFKTAAVRLRKSGGRITGLTAKQGEEAISIRARKGVILATGGITDSRELLEKYCPEALRADKNEYYPRGGNLGEMLEIARRAGAAWTRSGAVPVIHPVNFTPLGPGIQSSWLTVNREGRRFSCEMGFEPIVTNARLNAPGNLAWAVWDSRYAEHLRRQEPHKAAFLAQGLEEKMEAAVAAGDYLRADTLPALAEKMGVPADAFAETVARYNGWCDQGEDRDFGVPARFLSSVKEGPFYAARVSAWLLNVGYGLHVNADSQVLTEEDEPIGGLFAVGNMQGDFFANSYPVTCPGSNHGRAVVFGHLVGGNLARGKTLRGGDAG